MNREVFTTEDGSSSLFVPELNEQYHSVHGAIQEAKHVYLSCGLEYFRTLFPAKHPVSILEIGFGTGLNALLTAEAAAYNALPVLYTGLEAYPVTPEEWKALNYPQELNTSSAQKNFEAIHHAPWEEMTSISTHFSLCKRQMKFQEFTDQNQFDLIYFDAFGAQVQPELWEESIFKAMFESLKSEGVLVTYSAKGSVKRALKAVGFEVEKIPGPPGKREMLRALKR